MDLSFILSSDTEPVEYETNPNASGSNNNNNNNNNNPQQNHVVAVEQEEEKGEYEEGDDDVMMSMHDLLSLEPHDAEEEGGEGGKARPRSSKNGMDADNDLVPPMSMNELIELLHAPMPVAEQYSNTTNSTLVSSAALSSSKKRKRLSTDPSKSQPESKKKKKKKKRKKNRAHKKEKKKKKTKPTKAGRQRRRRVNEVRKENARALQRGRTFMRQRRQRRKLRKPRASSHTARQRSARTPQTTTAGAEGGAARSQASRTSRSTSVRPKRHGKSRPDALANMCLALETYAQRCETDGRDFDLNPDSLLKIIHHQSGTKAHHLDQKKNPCEAHDPLRHILSESTLCGAGTDMSVFRPSVHDYGLRNWPEQGLAPILHELRQLERAWHATENGPEEASEASESQEDPWERLVTPMEGLKIGFPEARPLW